MRNLREVNRYDAISGSDAKIALRAAGSVANTSCFVDMPEAWPSRHSLAALHIDTVIRARQCCSAGRAHACKVRTIQ